MKKEGGLKFDNFTEIGFLSKGAYFFSSSNVKSKIETVLSKVF